MKADRAVAVEIAVRPFAVPAQMRHVHYHVRAANVAVQVRVSLMSYVVMVHAVGSKSRILAA